MEGKKIQSEAELTAIRVRNYYLRRFLSFRGMITDDSGTYVYCDHCANIANFILLEFFEGMKLHVPVCEKHAKSFLAENENLQQTNQNCWIANPEDLERPSYSVLEKENAWLRKQVDQLTNLINTPHTDDFIRALPLEAAHQISRWGTEHDEGKTVWDWFWLIGYLAQKAASAALAGDTEKAKHHTISTAAVLLNWFRRLTGDDTSFRPGIESPKGKL